MRSIEIIWDASYSRASQDLSQEIGALSTFLDVRSKPFSSFLEYPLGSFHPPHPTSPRTPFLRRRNSFQSIETSAPSSRVSLSLLRDKCEYKSTFSCAEFPKLLDEIRAVVYDGCTRMEALGEKSFYSDMLILFTDGHSTIGDPLPKVLSPHFQDSHQPCSLRSRSPTSLLRGF